MTASTEPLSGVSVVSVSFTETSFTLIAQELAELCLDDLREFVKRCAHLPGAASLDVHSIRVNHRVYRDTASAESAAADPALLGADAEAVQS